MNKDGIKIIKAVHPKFDDYWREIEFRRPFWYHSNQTGAVAVGHRFRFWRPNRGLLGS